MRGAIEERKEGKSGMMGSVARKDFIMSEQSWNTDNLLHHFIGRVDIINEIICKIVRDGEEGGEVSPQIAGELYFLLDSLRDEAERTVSQRDELISQKRRSA